MKNEEFKKLKKGYEKIQKKGYVLDCGKMGALKTFKSLIKKNEQDFKEVDFKIKNDYTSKYTLLFKAVPTGKEANQIKRIRNKYGFAESLENRKKVFYGTVQGNASTFINGKLFRLKVDYDKKKIFLLILEKNFMLIDDKTYWTFADLEKKFNRRKKYLFMIKVWEKNENGERFYKYYDYYLLKLKDFKDFLKLIELGIIRVSFNVDIYRKGPKEGDIDDKGTVFEIEELDLEKLYQKVSDN